jgi:hypothetical protein
MKSKTLQSILEKAMTARPRDIIFFSIFFGFWVLILIPRSHYLAVFGYVWATAVVIYFGDILWPISEYSRHKLDEINNNLNNDKEKA